MNPNGNAKRKRARVDWEKVERLYRAGLLSLAEIGAECNCSKAAVCQRAKRAGWTRDIRARANAIAKQRVLREHVVNDLLNEKQGAPEGTVAALDVAAVEAQATAITMVRRRHIARIKAVSSLIDTLLDQLSLVAANRRTLEKMAAEIAKADGAIGAEQRRRAMIAAVSLGSHSATAERLINALRTLVNLERQAYGIDEKSDAPPDSLEQFLGRLAEKRRAAGRTIDVTPPAA